MPYAILILIPLVWVGWFYTVQPYDPIMSIFVMLAAECGTAVALTWKALPWNRLNA